MAYFTTPLDIVPDSLPGGYRDDAIFLKRVARKVVDDLHGYRQWQKNQAD